MSSTPAPRPAFAWARGQSERAQDQRHRADRGRVLYDVQNL